MSTSTKTNLERTEVKLLKNYCSKISDEDLLVLSTCLPQNIIGDRAEACYILQKDESVNGWLTHASSAEDWFNKVDSIGEYANLEIQERLKKSQQCL